MNLYNVRIAGGFTDGVDVEMFADSAEEAGKKAVRSWASRISPRNYRVVSVDKLEFLVMWVHGTNTRKGGVHPRHKGFSDKGKAEEFFNRLVGLKAEGKTYMQGSVVEIMKNF